MEAQQINDHVEELENGGEKTGDCSKHNDLPFICKFVGILG